MKKIPFGKPAIVGPELEYIAQAVASGSIAGDGVFTRKSHALLQSLLGCKSALLTHSGTAALEMAAILCDIQPGDEVIMPSFTFVTTANAVVLRGGVPVFVDIREDTLNLDERLIEAAITPRTKAITVVHYAGRACDMDTVMAIADRHGLRVVEDAAHALLSRYRGRSLGAIGHLGCVSFHETKNVISGEGGALLINDPELIERAEIIREKGTNRSRFFRGQVDKYTWVDIGSSYLPSELVSAFLYAQLERVEEINEKRREICRMYHARLRDLSASGRIHIRETLEGEDFNGHIFYLITKDLEERTALIRHLGDRGIAAVFHYVPLHSSPAGMQYGRSHGRLPVTDRIGDRLLRLPLFLELTAADIERVCDEIHRFYRSC
jgi:dTDP-4-amino-4,6-dideoxygalactose transaminase